MTRRKKTRPVWLGLDIGGTRLKAGVIDDRGNVLNRAVVPTSPRQTHRAFEEQLGALAAKALGRRRASLAGIGASITGAVDPSIGCVYLPGKIAGLDRHRTVPYLRRRWGVPAIADNDGRMACFGEWRAGAAAGWDNVVVFTLGTGIGSGVVLDGHLLNDRHFQRGTQCGHMIIDRHGPRCLTGPRGTGESLASITALVQLARDHVARGLATRLSAKSAHELGFVDIVRAARRGDPLSRGLFEEWLDRFAAVLLNAFYAYTPDLILLAGGPTQAADLFVGKLETRLNEAAFRVPVGYRIPVRVARLGEDAGWLGSALWARENFGKGGAET